MPSNVKFESHKIYLGLQEKPNKVVNMSFLLFHHQPIVQKKDMQIDSFRYSSWKYEIKINQIMLFSRNNVCLHFFKISSKEDK